MNIYNYVFCDILMVKNYRKLFKNKKVFFEYIMIYIVYLKSYVMECRGK